jgi:hypothetical protein
MRCWRLIGCVLRGAAFVVVMQTAHFTNLDHGALCWRLYSSGLRRVFAERQVSSPPIGRVEDWRRCSAGSAYPLLPVSVGSASLAEP